MWIRFSEEDVCRDFSPRGGYQSQELYDLPNGFALFTAWLALFSLTFGHVVCSFL